MRSYLHFQSHWEEWYSVLSRIQFQMRSDFTQVWATFYSPRSTVLTWNSRSFWWTGMMQKASKVPYICLVFGSLPFFLRMLLHLNLPTIPCHMGGLLLSAQHPDKGTWGDKETSLKSLSQKPETQPEPEPVLSDCSLRYIAGFPSPLWSAHPTSLKGKKGRIFS